MSTKPVGARDEHLEYLADVYDETPLRKLIFQKLGTEPPAPRITIAIADWVRSIGSISSFREQINKVVEDHCAEADMGIEPVAQLPLGPPPMSNSPPGTCSMESMPPFPRLKPAAELWPSEEAAFEFRPSFLLSSSSRSSAGPTTGQLRLPSFASILNRPTTTYFKLPSRWRRLSCCSMRPSKRPTRPVRPCWQCPGKGRPISRARARFGLTLALRGIAWPLGTRAHRFEEGPGRWQGPEVHRGPLATPMELVKLRGRSDHQGHQEREQGGGPEGQDQGRPSQCFGEEARSDG